MRRTPALFFAATRSSRLQCTRHRLSTSPPIIHITNGTFYRRHPASKPSPDQHATPNPPLFPNLTLSLPSISTPTQHWAVLSPSSEIRTAFLQILRGQYICFPPTARSFPYLLSDEISSKAPELRNSSRAIEYVGFDVERQAFGGAYLSARYESRVEQTDFSLARYLTGDTDLNPSEEAKKEVEKREALVRRVVKDLELEALLERPVSQLSNGQSRRARIGKALLRGPEMVCLDAPFIGLDPFVTRHISSVLHRLAEARSPRIVLSLRPQDEIPAWITHIVYAGEDGNVDASAIGPKEEVFAHLKQQYENSESAPSTTSTPISSPSPSQTLDIDPKLVEIRKVGRHLSSRGDFRSPETPDPERESERASRLSRDGYPHTDASPAVIGEPIVQMDGVVIKYANNTVLGDWTQTSIPTPFPSSPSESDSESQSQSQSPAAPLPPGLHLAIHRNQRYCIFGPNGSGKTTFLSLVTSDHPQTYAAPVRLFGRSRLPSLGVPGISIFELQARMGHASPEVHALFPKSLSVRQALETAWAETPVAKPRLDAEARERVRRVLWWFAGELNPQGLKPQTAQTAQTATDADLQWASTTTFHDLSFSSQRLLLFLRATLRNPEIVILDEAFSGMDDAVRDKAMLFLSRGESMELHYPSAGTSAGPPIPRESAIARKNDVVLKGLQDHQALVCVSHSRHEVPGCVREWVCLPEGGTGRGMRVGRWEGPVELEGGRWEEVWGGN